MPKDKVSDWSSTAANNTDVGGINIAEGMAPSGVNNAMREIMAQIKDMQAGTDGDYFSKPSVEDIYETLISSSPTIKFGIAFCEASGKRLVRSDGNA